MLRLPAVGFLKGAMKMRRVLILFPVLLVVGGLVGRSEAGLREPVL
jgi:hypothetical protein